MENSQSIDMTNSNFHTTSNSKGLDFIDAQQMDSEINLGNSETIIFNKNGGNGEMDNEIKKKNQQIKENSLTLDSSEQQLQQTDTPPLSFTATSTSKLKQLGLHPLRTKWTLWFLQGKERTQGGNSSNDWLDRLKDVSTVDTVEDFWALYDNIRPPSALPMQSDYCFFKNGIKPVWEVPENKEGGRLIIQIDKGRMDCLDTFWLEVLLALIGEQFEKEDSDLICGAVCNIRQKGSKICLWTKNVEAEVSNKRIGHIMKQRCQNIIGGASVKVNYEEHIATQNKSSSAMKYRFYLP